jgi:ABC-2 type transport system ATP-binding protein
VTAIDPDATPAVPPRPDPVITARGLRRAFPTGVALDGLDLDVDRGEVLVLLGPNGAGKTTTVRLLNGVLRPDAGEARVLGLDPARDGDDLRRRTGVLTENAGLDDRLTAHENLAFTARIRGMSKRAARARAEDLLEQFGLTERAGHPVQGMSTGQRKRLALLRAMVHDPEVLFLDEPTSGLDPAATRAVVELIGSLARDRGRTVVLCTHFLGEAGQLADRMAVLDRGVLWASGRPSDLARTLFPDVSASIDIGRPPTTDEERAVRDLPGVVDVGPDAAGLKLRVLDRTDVATVVAALVRRGVAVYAATPRVFTLEDVYFAIERRIAEHRPDPTRPIAATADTLAVGPREEAA